MTIIEKKKKRHNMAFIAKQLGISLSRLRRLISGRGVNGRKLSIDQAASMPPDQLEQIISNR